MTNDKRRQIKIHLFFGGAVVLTLLYGLFSHLSSGERFFQALWSSVTGVRPFEWLMIVLFWYSFAYPRPQNNWTTGQVTTLGLAERE